LQHLLGGGEGLVKGVTSIGYDGEEVDQVTSTHKPRIYVEAGSLVGTAAGLLGRCDFTKEYLGFTGYYTPLGEVVVVRALSDGYAMLAGPSKTVEMQGLVKQLYGYGAKRVLIDGAAARKSSASLEAADACILATGASFSHDIQQITQETAFFCELLGLKRVEADISALVAARVEAALGSKDSANLCLVYDGQKQELACLSSLEQGAADELAQYCEGESGITVVFVGVVSRLFMQRFLSKSRDLKDVTLVAQDGTRLLIASEQYESLLKRGARLFVLKELNPLAITINPVSPKGFKLDGTALKQSLEAQIKLPVFDVFEASSASSNKS
jgi:hypothetical protein